MSRRSGIRFGDEGTRKQAHGRGLNSANGSRNPCAMQYFTSGDLSLAFLDAPPTGDDRGEPILLVHGFASTHAVNWVFPHWVRALTGDGRRVIALDNRGHGRSDKPYEVEAYHTANMAGDALALMDHLGIRHADVMGYSMGARIGAWLTLEHPDRARSLVLGGLGDRLIDKSGLPDKIAEAMEAESLDDLTDPQQRTFRAFADATLGDRRALAACIRGSRQALTPSQVGEITIPVMVCVGTRDDVAGDPHALAAMIPGARGVDIPGRDHNRAVGDKVYREAVLEFLAERP